MIDAKDPRMKEEEASSCILHVNKPAIQWVLTIFMDAHSMGVFFKFSTTHKTNKQTNKKTC